MNDEKNFTYIDSCDVEHSIQITPDDLKLTQVDKEIHDTKFQSKPTTFFKDALRRFVKNKSSVAGAVVLGLLVLGCIFIPVIDPSDVSTIHPEETFLEPKLFEAGTGFWDGCRSFENVTVDFDWEQYEKDGTYVGFPADVNSAAIVGGQAGVHMSKVGEHQTNAYNKYAHGGTMRLTNDAGIAEDATLISYPIDLDITNYDLSLSIAVAPLPADFEYGEIGNYSFSLRSGEQLFALSSFSTDVKTHQFDLSGNTELQAYASANGGIIPSASLITSIKGNAASVKQQSILLSSVVFSSEKASAATSEEGKAYALELKNVGFTDANKAVGIAPRMADGTVNKYYWVCPSGTREVYRADMVVCSYSFDTYTDRLGLKNDFSFKLSEVNTYIRKGWLNAKMTLAELRAERYSDAACQEFVDGLSLTAEGLKYCPLRLDEGAVGFSKQQAGGDVAVSVVGICSNWRYLGYTSCPKYLLGTDASGRDMLEYAFAGLRTSLLLGLVTFLVNFIFGLVWGSISGYFGGWTDILMERFTDILSGVPWIVVMTLCIILMGQNFFVFALALCLTGWIGTSHLTRTQFYRFKSREYILAARTLGASDKRLIFRHILPNAIGTIITSSVLMIPSVIFSEATISYLNLGLQGMSSFGVILSDNQRFLQNYPYLIVFPSVVMALMMISFNLFGNGLRDAFNPSLKGQD